MTTAHNVLADCEALRGLDEQHLTVLQAGAQPFTRRPGEFLAQEGEPATRFYVLCSGHVAIGIHTPAVRVQTVGPGDVIGWSWLMSPHRWDFDCWAIDRVQGFLFEAAWLREQCENNTDLGYRFLTCLLRVLAGRLAAMRAELLATYRPRS